MATGALGWLVIAAGGTGHSGAAPPSVHLGGVAAMTVATMGPYAIPAVRSVAFASPWWRARRSVLLSFAGFAGAWIALASLLHLGVESLPASLLSGRALAVLLVAGVAVSALGAARGRRLRSCARLPALRAGGVEADVDCCRAGAGAATACARLCWPAMAAMLAVPGSWWPMAALTAVGLAERALAPRGRRLAAAAYAACATGLVLG